MSADAPPPYTATDETKISLAQQPTVHVGLSVSTDPQYGQAALAQVPTAPPGYETVAYYPAASTSAGTGSGASILLQPQSQQLQQQLQQQPQVIVIQSPQVVVARTAVQQPVTLTRSFATHICLACCSFFCCFSCPCSIASFILAREYQ